MGSTVAISSGCTSESGSKVFGIQSLLRRPTTSDDRVVLPDPGGPARPTRYLWVTETNIRFNNNKTSKADTN